MAGALRMNVTVITILVLLLILFGIIILVQKGTIMALKAELKELKHWINRNHVSDFWNR
jgi:hypothetical protein